MLIRPAAIADAAAICTIYNQGIEDRVATLETELRTPDERCEWLAASVSARCPPSERVGTGWGSLNRFNPRAAYDHVADLSVYVERGYAGVRSPRGRPRRAEGAVQSTPGRPGCSSEGRTACHLAPRPGSP